jgi:hypothetical protein
MKAPLYSADTLDFSVPPLSALIAGTKSESLVITISAYLFRAELRA